jgi:hypothetical protein
LSRDDIGAVVYPREEVSDGQVNRILYGSRAVLWICAYMSVNTGNDGCRTLEGLSAYDQ